VIERQHADAAQSDLDDVAILSAASHPIANLEGTVEHDGDAGDERGDQIAQREADGERECTAYHRERRGVEANTQANGQNEGDHVEREAGGRLYFLDGETTVREANAQAITGVVDQPNQEHRPEDERDGRGQAAPAHEPGELAEIGQVLCVRDLCLREQREGGEGGASAGAHACTSMCLRSSSTRMSRSHDQAMRMRPPSSTK
jgi:hypothetical protein